MSRPGGAERLRQAGRLLAGEGARGVALRLLRRAERALGADEAAALPLRPEEIERAGEIALEGRPLPGPAPRRDGEPLRVAWVCRPPGEGSGGHTTMFRMAAALERAGHECALYLDDRHGWALDQHRRTVRAWWPWLSAEVRDLRAGIADAHAVLATSWETAYPVLASPARGARCYFVQDFEPAFHPAGGIALLAEETYRFGFHGIAAGRWLAELLRDRYGMASDHFELGVDRDLYDLGEGEGERDGVCWFCRPSTPRRAHETAVLTLARFAARRPEVTIHVYGERPGRLPFPFVDHGLLPPPRLADLYRRCAAGLALSATNVSLVPCEMLACGCRPVVNEAARNRLVLGDAAALYARPNPAALAAALERLVLPPPPQRRAAARAAAASVAGRGWEGAEAEFVAALEGAVDAARGPRVGADPPARDGISA